MISVTETVANLVNKHYNTISCVGLNTYKFVFVFVDMIC